ncbi:hypothetical protein FOMPIDRAFT_15809, partial [Fomitopsis schrenkii]
ALVMSGRCDEDLRIWEVKSGHCICPRRPHTSTIRCPKVLHGQPIAVTGSRDCAVHACNIQRGRLPHTLEGHKQSVQCVPV